MREPVVVSAVDVTAVLSTLHEPPGRCSAGRMFRGEPVLAWTLKRLSRSQRIARVALLCWEDQQPKVGPIAAAMGAFCSVRTPRIKLPQIESVAAARRWADGWRGGLLGACEFDRGFHGSWIAEIQQKVGGEAVLLVDPAAALVDPVLIDALVDHAAANEEVDFIFSPVAPGLSGVLIRKSMLDQLAASRTHPGTLLNYRPDLALRDPISSPACAPVATNLARTTQRFMLDCDRQIDRISHATQHLNGELIATAAEQLLLTLPTVAAAKLPREVVLELNVRRISRPIHWPGAHLKIERPDMPLESAIRVIDELRDADDMRLVLAGVGDPMLSPHVFDVIDCAHRAGIAVALETDLLGIDDATIDRLAESSADIVSVNLPAASAKTYEAVMGIDAVKSAMQNVKRLIERRETHSRGTPLIVPTFIKTNANLADMEPCYDHWLRTLGCAVIAGSTDYAGQIPDVSPAQMEPPRRQACARLAQRLTILCDGLVVSCEQDVLARQCLGHIGEDSIAKIWAGMAAALRGDHQAGQWNRHPLCAACHDWHRP